MADFENESRSLMSEYVLICFSCRERATKLRSTSPGTMSGKCSVSGGGGSKLCSYSSPSSTGGSCNSLFGGGFAKGLEGSLSDDDDELSLEFSSSSIWITEMDSEWCDGGSSKSDKVSIAISSSSGGRSPFDGWSGGFW